MVRPADLPRVEQWTRYWTGQVTTVFWNAYRHHPGMETLLPATADDENLLLEVFRLERTLLELARELRTPGNALQVTLESVLAALTATRARPPAAS